MTTISSQITNAFSFIQKLYNESSYLLKEIEGQLSESSEKFLILKPSGYSISSRSSTGLEPNNVNFWLLRKFAVGFVEESKIKIKNGQSVTEINSDLKVLYFRIVLNSKASTEPKLIFGVFKNISNKKEKGRVKKFENLMGHFEYNDNKIFSNLSDVKYEDSVVKLEGCFSSINLLEIESSEELQIKVVEPALQKYRS